MIRKSTLTLAIVSCLLLLSAPAMAVPMLQLGIEGGYYDSGTQTIITDASSFGVDALLTANNDEGASVDVTATYYLSIAVVPKTSSPGVYGTFELDGVTKLVTGDMSLGVPSALWGDPDLPSHGIFDTYFLEVDFIFDGSTTQTYNTQDAAQDGSKTLESGDSYINSWTIDVANLGTDVNLHFDLYTVLEDKLYKAPFSHDAETRVPEPGTLVLLGIGILGVAAYRRKVS